MAGNGQTEPARYALLFGSPVPGCKAPAGRTMEPGTRVIRRLMRARSFLTNFSGCWRDSQDLPRRPVGLFRNRMRGTLSRERRRR
nr:WHG domain-containing protein [Arthrobacter sp.]